MDNVNELKTQAMRYWGKLKENDFTEFHGDLEQLKAKVQSSYGYTQEELDDEFKAFLKRFKKKQAPQPDLTP